MDIRDRINKELYFVTDTVVDWVDIFTRPKYKHIVLESLKYCQQEKGLHCCCTVLSYSLSVHFSKRKATVYILAFDKILEATEA